MTSKQAARSGRAESPQMMALAFNDAVRDILHADGVFPLRDDRRGDAVWEWDGVRWKRLPLVDEPAKEEPPSVEIEPDAEMAWAP